jgi:putative endonuclease
LLLAERLPDIETAIRREKQLKNWHRDWKLNLIKQENPELNDLAKDWFSKQDIQATKGNK